jgi:HSP20 family protein
MSTTMTTTNQNTNGKARHSELATPENRCEDRCVQEPVATFVPRCDVWEGNDEFVLYGDLPGVDPDSLEIEFNNNQLTVHGKVCHRQNDVRLLYAEYGTGDFHRIFTVGESVDCQRISAELCDGVLTVRMPKVEKAKSRRIEVKTG